MNRLTTEGHSSDADEHRSVTSPTAITMPHNQSRKHIVVSRGKFASAISAQGHNARLEIWLAGWRIEIYDEFDEQRHPFGAR